MAKSEDMPRLPLLACLLPFALFAASEPYPVSAATASVPHPAADAPGFVGLFNGKDLAGWKTKGNWVYDVDGTVTLQPRWLSMRKMFFFTPKS